MDLTLKVISGKHAGKKLRIPAPKFLIGRGEDCQLRPNGELISRRHCELLVETDSAVVRDLNSRNGTFVNDERVVGERRLQAGDRLRIGQFIFEVRLAAPIASAPAKVLDVAETRQPDPIRGDDDDVMEWFKEEPRRAAHETVEISASDTSQVAAFRETLADQPAVPQETAKPTPVPFARPTPQGLATKNSVDAATEALNKFLKGR